MKGKIGTSTYIFSLFPKKLSKNISDLNKRLSRYIRKYNYIRPHQGLRFKTPADIAYGM